METGSENLNFNLSTIALIYVKNVFFF